MPHDHDHHGHDHDGHGHAPRPSAAQLAAEGPLDAANQSLADALRASFRLLKLVMFALLVAYLFSGVQCVQNYERAVVLRFGKLLPGTREPGVSWAFPFPIDETLRFPTQNNNQFLVRHWPKVNANQETQPLDKVRSGGGLNPAVDGGLLTADSGIVHFQWNVTYRVDNLRNYVLNIADEETDDVEALITMLIDEAAVHTLSEHTAEAATRGGTETIAAEVRRRVNDKLEALATGVDLVSLNVNRSSVPGQTIQAFTNVTIAENERRKAIRDAELKAAEILNHAAGSAHPELLVQPEALTAAESSGNAGRIASAGTQFEQLLENRAGGEAGRAIRHARGTYTEMIQQIQSDAEEYDSAMKEYKRSPALFIERMWEQTRQRVLRLDEVVKHYVAARANEVRIKIGPDPRQREIDETRALQQEAQRIGSGPTGSR